LERSRKKVGATIRSFRRRLTVFLPAKGVGGAREQLARFESMPSIARRSLGHGHKCAIFGEVGSVLRGEVLRTRLGNRSWTSDRYTLLATRHIVYRCLLSQAQLRS
jgi:hypothetical protein